MARKVRQVQGEGNLGARRLRPQLPSTNGARAQDPGSAGVPARLCTRLLRQAGAFARCGGAAYRDDSMVLFAMNPERV